MQDNIISALILISLALIIVIAVLLIKKTLDNSKSKINFGLNRHPNNPVMSPHAHHDWENVGTFNPGALQDKEGNVHLLYRAIGGGGLSSVGHAESKDGINFKRSLYPVFQPPRPPQNDPKEPRIYNPSYYTSGGGWGGCEDPRAVQIEDRIYMTYVAFEGWGSIKMAVTSISEEDFKKKKWNWKKPVVISPEGETHKNWVLFPEKINGKFAILHGISPNILIDYLDSLDNFYNKEKIKSKPPKGGRQEFWDNWVRGAGPPPIKTSAGWLLLYHAMDKNDPNKYKIGAMILDLNDPKKILYRAPKPILSPEMPYENDGKPGVVYASGAIVRDDKLYVYYGGGDKHVCVAETKLQPLLDWLMKNGKVE
jgi:predicted GH43/DUF377 family glycosyl hydrolase